MNKYLSKFPLFVFLFAAYPSLTLLASNIRQLDPAAVWRPLIGSMVFALIVFAAAYAILRNRVKSSFISIAISAVFFIYGHLYIYLNGHLPFDKAKWLQVIFTYGFPFLMLALVTAAAKIVQGRDFKEHSSIYLMLNVMAIVLLVFPLYTIISIRYQQSRFPIFPDTNVQTAGKNTPDVYYILLDAYARQDAMKWLGYDNSAFIDELKNMGFYVASCSRSNYPQTLLSMTSSFNMGYLWEAVPNSGANDRNRDNLHLYLRHSLARHQFKQRGYKIVGLETEYEWLNLRDADIYLHPDRPSFFSWKPTVFEYLFLETTALRPLMETSTAMRYKYISQYDRVIYDLDELPRIAKTPGPKFVYSHITVPHPPNIFMPDGSLNPDPNYYARVHGVGINYEYDVKGYINNAKFINSRLPAVLKAIIANSEVPPVIIIQGDHGYKDPKIRFEILNAYFMPGGKSELLYPTISPVNSFRVVFNAYLGADYPLLEDKSYNVGLTRPFGKKPAGPSLTECK